MIHQSSFKHASPTRHKQVFARLALALLARAAPQLRAAPLDGVMAQLSSMAFCRDLTHGDGGERRRVGLLLASALDLKVTRRTLAQLEADGLGGAGGGEGEEEELSGAMASAVPSGGGGDGAGASSGATAPFTP